MEPAANESVALTVHCPQCTQSYRLSEEQHHQMVGKRIKCRKCQTAFLIDAIGASAAGQVVAPGHEDADRFAGEYNLADSNRRGINPPPPPPPYGPAESATSGGMSGRVLTFEGSFTPAIGLLAGEEVQEAFEATAWDLGILGWLLGNKKRLVLTNRRVIRFEKKVMVNTLDMIWLPSVTGASVGQALRPGPFVLSTLLAIWSIAMFFGGLIGVFGRAFTRAGNREGDGGAAVIVAIILLSIAAVLFLQARVKVMLVMTAGTSTGLKLTRLQSAESRRFVDAVFRAVAGSRIA
jgi:hypothetical protein